MGRDGPGQHRHRPAARELPIPDPLHSDWAWQLPAHGNTLVERLRGRAAERQLPTTGAVLRLLVPPDVPDAEAEHRYREICNELEAGTLKPESVLQGRKPEEVLGLGREGPAPRAEHSVADAPQERAHGTGEGTDQRRKEKNRKKKLARKARKNAMKLGTVNEDAPLEQAQGLSALHLSDSRASGAPFSSGSSAQSDDDVSSQGTSVWHEHQGSKM